jgi:hypothetical protein
MAVAGIAPMGLLFGRTLGYDSAPLNLKELLNTC